jgi:LAS superfamily LD-carboxypeptidase LdcB
MSPASLKTIDPAGHQLCLECANDFIRMREAAQLAGHEIHISTAYRSNGEQKKLYAKYVSDIAAWERSGRIGSRPTPVAIPGKSLHEKGQAVDIHVATDPGLKAWLDAHCKEFNFRCDVPHEPWHYSWYAF